MIEINNQTESSINIKLVEKIISLFLHDNNVNKDISLAFVGDKEIQRLNKKYRAKDTITDVLSFEGGGDFFGEILINYQQIKRQAKEYSASSQAELVFILVHALYHLLGYEDETEKDKEEMNLLGKYFIKKYNLS